MSARVVVVGSVNRDISTFVDHLPLAGETVIGLSTHIGVGGKGANQACAAAQMGLAVSFLGRVGSDESGRSVLELLERWGIDLATLQILEGEQTGAAYITVDSAGQNSIVVASGANSLLRPADIAANSALLSAASVVVAQAEIPADTLDELGRMLHAEPARFVLNLAPFAVLQKSTLASADPLVVNEVEAQETLAAYGLSASAIESIPEALAAAEQLATISRSVVITLGAQGAAVAQGGHSWHEPAPSAVRVVDTTGAGDAFVGVLSAALASGDSLEVAVRSGVGAGTLSVTRTGSTGSYPTAEELELFISSGTGAAGAG